MDFSSFTIAQVREWAREQGIDLPPRKVAKAQLVEIINKNITANTSPVDQLREEAAEEFRNLGEANLKEAERNRRLKKVAQVAATCLTALWMVGGLAALGRKIQEKKLPF